LVPSYSLQVYRAGAHTGPLFGFPAVRSSGFVGRSSPVGVIRSVSKGVGLRKASPSPYFRLVLGNGQGPFPRL